MPRILLADESPTVQKVVSLTLDKNRYELCFAKTRHELARALAESPIDIVMVSDQNRDIDIRNFPQEVASKTPPSFPRPTIVLISSHAKTAQGGFASVLKKPFAPDDLRQLIEKFSGFSNVEESSSDVGLDSVSVSESDIDLGLSESRFNAVFSDESRLMEETLSENALATSLYKEGPAVQQTAAPRTPEPSRAQGGVSNLWQPGPPPSGAQKPVLKATHDPKDFFAKDGAGLKVGSDSLTQDELSKLEGEMNHEIEARIEKKLDEKNLTEIVDRVLSKVVPPIVERIVQERLDKLMKEQDIASLNE